MLERMNPPRITVVGSSNYDITTFVPRLPRSGETLRGDRLHTCFGGKGANQAIMATKLGARVSMVTKLGRDPFGDATLENFAAHGIDTTHVHRTADAASGVATISVDPTGANTIVVAAGANALLSPSDIDAARDVIEASDAVIAQLEVPVPTVERALHIARDAGVRTIFNPAPTLDGSIDALVRLSDVICPNEAEAAHFTGRTVDSRETAAAAADVLRDRGARCAIVTLGALGCWVTGADGSFAAHAERVEAVDTTGAGDAFVGSLACLLVAGASLPDAVQGAVAVATQSVLGAGTQSSYPTRGELSPRVLRLFPHP